MAVYTVENTAAAGRPAIVYLNGVEADKVIKADDVENYIIRYKTDAAGNIQLTKRGDCLVTERVNGPVTVDILDHA